jgi:hypothetical protein
MHTDKHGFKICVHPFHLWLMAPGRHFERMEMRVLLKNYSLFQNLISLILL